MRLAALFLRSRRAGWALAVLAAVAVACWALTWFLVSGTSYGVARGGLTLLLVFGALAAACVLGAGAGSPFGEAEKTAARPLAPLRLGHLGGLLLWAALVLAAVLLLFDLDGARPRYPLLVLARDVAALGGTALLAACLAGARLSWIPPLVFSVAYLTAMGSGSDALSSFASRSYHGLHGPSWIGAILLLFAGMCLVCLYGTPEAADESG